MTRWEDASRNGNHAVLTTDLAGTSTPPEYSATGSGGIPSLYFVSTSGLQTVRRVKLSRASGHSTYAIFRLPTADDTRRGNMRLSYGPSWTGSAYEAYSMGFEMTADMLYAPMQVGANAACAGAALCCTRRR